MNKELKTELYFLGKIVRNGFILSGMMFASTFATGDLNYELVKPIIVFFMGYLFTELGRRYKLTPQAQRTKIVPMVF